MTHNIQLVVLNVDGCLTAGKGNRLDVEEFIHIREWVDTHQNTPVVLCTGRSQPYVEALLHLIGTYHKGIPNIVENGCFLYYAHIDEDIIVPNPAMKTAPEELAAAKIAILKDVAGIAKYEPGKEVCLSLNPTQEGLSVEDLYARVREVAQPYSDIVDITHSASAVDVTPKGINKGNALTVLSEKTGVPTAAMLGVGDTVGDMPMLEAVGTVACPANATEDVRTYVTQRGGYVARQSDVCGVVEILHHYSD